MKLIELPISIYQSSKLIFTPLKSFKVYKKKRLPVILSLTSIPSRLNTLHITIRSLFNQEELPEKIILWLHIDLKNKIPNQLEKLVGELFEIKFSNYTFSHRKLIHSLESFPNKIIITCDDDIIYHPTCIKLLYKEHLNHPKNVIGNRCRRITYDNSGNLLPYLQWPYIPENKIGDKLIMPVGAFCVLYPPKCLDKRVLNIELINKLSPKADDLWFKAMALLNKTISIQAETSPPEPVPIIGTQKISLKKTNARQDYNRIQWKHITKYFNLEL